MTDSSDTFRKIVHVDMDAFFASVEQRDNPDLRGRPVAVGGARERGVVAAASYEARVFGVRSAMPSVTARRKCPELVFVKPRFEIYRAVSQEIQGIFAEHTALVEPLSLDEAYLDVTENHRGIALASEIAATIRAEIFAQTGLTASAGISYNKFLAKMASGRNKPNGQFSIPPGRGEAFIEALPIGKFHGVGPATAKKMQSLGIHTGADLKQRDEVFLQDHFGKSGAYFYRLARAVDHRTVQPDRIRKSVGAENTFFDDLHDFDQAKAALDPLIDKVVRGCTSKGLKGRTVTLKVKYNDFEQITRSRSLPVPMESRDQIASHACAMLEGLFPLARPIRLLGVTLSSFDTETPAAASPHPQQMALFA